ncbi:MAG: NUDIX domain-containing protein [Xanthomonadales bacterium]|nr:NUDIX domain-containing protein [Xanthomonadales bacterium]
MQLNAGVFDVWVFRRRAAVVEFLLLHTAIAKANRYFNGGRFWQIPSNPVQPGESITAAIDRLLNRFGLRAKTIWAGEHAYLIYNRRFEEMQAIGVYAAEVAEGSVILDPAEHAEFAWLPYQSCLDRVHYRGLKDGLRSVHEYITGVEAPAPELCLYAADQAASAPSEPAVDCPAAPRGPSPDH